MISCYQESSLMGSVPLKMAFKPQQHTTGSLTLLGLRGNSHIFGPLWAKSSPNFPKIGPVRPIWASFLIILWPVFLIICYYFIFSTQKLFWSFTTDSIVLVFWTDLLKIHLFCPINPLFFLLKSIF